MALLVAGCSRDQRALDTSEASLPLHVDVRADTGDAQFVVVVPPPAQVWVSRVAPARSSPSAESELPAATPDSVISESQGAAPLLEIDDDLKAPILRSRPVLEVPSEYSRMRRVRSVELDVRVDEQGLVTDALLAGGNGDSTLVLAATECAFHMRFYPALQAGAAIPVWCRQRFDFGFGGPFDTKLLPGFSHHG